MGSGDVTGTYISELEMLVDKVQDQFVSVLILLFSPVGIIKSERIPPSVLAKFVELQVQASYFRF